MASPQLAVLQVNFHQSKAAVAAFAKQIASVHTGISMIQEPWVVGGAIKGFGAIGDVDVHRSNFRPRAWIVLRSQSGVRVLCFCNRDLAAMAWEIKLNDVSKTFIFASAYFPHDDDERS